MLLPWVREAFIGRKHTPPHALELEIFKPSLFSQVRLAGRSDSIRTGPYNPHKPTGANAACAESNGSGGFPAAILTDANSEGTLSAFRASNERDSI